MQVINVRLKPYSLTELTKVYGVCIKTMHKWLDPFKDEIGEKKGRFFTISQVKLIFEKLGLPAEIVGE